MIESKIVNFIDANVFEKTDLILILEIRVRSLYQ